MGLTDGALLGTHLVLDLAVDFGDVDSLCEGGGGVFLKLDGLGPVVEGAGYVDFFGRMIPIVKRR